MGIDGLWNAISDDLTKLVPFSSFKGRRIAIDASGLFYAYRATARKQIISSKSRDLIAKPFEETEADSVWINSCLKIIMEIMSHGITPVLVFDGKPSELKTRVRQDRIEEKRKFREEYEELVLKVKNTSMFCHNTEDMDRIRTCLCSMGNMDKRATDLIKNFLFGIGVPVLQCKEEAERLCASLVREGYAAGSLCEDGDSLVHGCNITLKKISPHTLFVENREEKAFEMIEMCDVLSKLSLSMDEFRDAAILSGCDYNRKDKIKGIAFAKAMKELKIWKSLDNVPMTPELARMNHRECRELFLFKPAIEMIESGCVDVNIDIERISSYMSMYGMMNSMDKFMVAISQCLAIANNYTHKPLVSTSVQSGEYIIEDDDVPVHDTLVNTSPVPKGGVSKYKKKSTKNSNTMAPLALAIQPQLLANLNTNIDVAGYGLYRPVIENDDVWSRLEITD